MICSERHGVANLASRECSFAVALVLGVLPTARGGLPLARLACKFAARSRLPIQVDRGHERHAEKCPPEFRAN
jgi:hypothetical protein